MKNKLYYIDSPGREAYIDKACAPEPVEVLDSDYSRLFASLMEQAETVLFPLTNGETATFPELMRYQALFILEQIKAEPSTGDPEEIARKLYDWYKCLRHNPDLKLYQVLAHLQKSHQPPAESLSILQSGYAEFRYEIEQAGITDPALATLDLFIRHYSQVVSRFNPIWKRLSEFYVWNILHKRPYSAIPDQTWVVVNKREEADDVMIPEQTPFVAGKNDDGTDFCYYSTEEVAVTRLKLESVSSILFKQEEMYVDNKKLRFVNTILKKSIHTDAYQEPETLFDLHAKRGEKHFFVTSGLRIESPMFQLQEGYRTVSLHLYLTPDSVQFFRRYATDFSGDIERERNIYYRLLNKAFYLEISTEEGWRNIPSYEVKYVSEELEDYLALSFVLDYDFPVPQPCVEQRHGVDSCMPALNILINRDAPIFPYSWASKLYFSRLCIQNDVKGITSLEVYNENGQQNTHSSFFPFGVQAERSSWMIAGYKEAFCKPLTEVAITCKWQQLPDIDGGFESYYADYGKRITNESFRVRTEYLKNKNWTPTSSENTPLFATSSRQRYLLPESRISWPLNKNMPVLTGVAADNYRYGSVNTGFIRMVLDEPDCGFGATLYQNLFVNNLIKRGNKEEITLLQQPFVPTIDNMEMQYQAEESITLSSREMAGNTRIYHISPIATKNNRPIKGDSFVLVDGPQEEGFLQFAFSQATGYDTIRIFAELIPSKEEFDKQSLSSICWFFHDGSQWVPLNEEAVVRDSTGNFLNSGIIELRLPTRIQSSYLDEEGLFWLYAAFPKNHLNYPTIYGIFLHVIPLRAELNNLPGNPSGTESLPAGTIQNTQRAIPGINSIMQLRSSLGGTEKESLNGMLFRSSNQALFRKKPATAEDYERFALELFPFLSKVKCFPACDTKNNDRKGVVTLVVMQEQPDGRLPLCPYNQLFDIEDKLQQYVNPFVIIDVINPVFEEVIVRSNITLRPGTYQSPFLKRLRGMLNSYIAPWLESGTLPAFGHTITVNEVRELLEDQPEIETVHQLSLIVVMNSIITNGLEGSENRKILEFTEEKGDVPIRASHPWYIQVPSKEHLLFTCSPEDYTKEFGTGELEIDNTFIIKT